MHYGSPYRKLSLQHFVETYEPTIEDSYRKQVVIDSRSCMLEVLDTAGQEEYTALRDQWIREAEGIVLVYSISSRSSFTRVSKFINAVRRVKESAATPLDSGAPIQTPDQQIPICLVGNKCDRVTEREVSTQEGHAIAKELGCDVFVECSAKNCINVEKAFYDVVRILRKRRENAIRPSLSRSRRDSQSATPSDAQGYYPIKRTLWRKKISIPPGEGKSEAGRKRLTTSLVSAAKANHESVVIAFLEAGAQVNGQPGADGAAIHAASASGHPNIVNILLKKGAAVNAKGPSGTSPLQAAAAEGHLAVVRLLLHKGAQIDQTSQLHGTALSAAASRGRLAVVQYLLKKNANVNVVGGPYGNTLQAAAWVGRSGIVEALLDHGADINARGAGDCTALQIASFAGHAQVIRTLLNRGGAINIDAPGGKYGCALKAADDHGHFEAVKVLLEAGATSTLPTPAKRGIDGERDEPTPEVTSDDVKRPVTSAKSLALALQTLSQSPSYTSPETLPRTASNNNRLRSSTLSVTERPHISAVGFSDILNPADSKIE